MSILHYFYFNRTSNVLIECEFQDSYSKNLFYNPKINQPCFVWFSLCIQGLRKVHFKCGSLSIIRMTCAALCRIENVGN